jgi:hypothetical protein
MIADADLPVDLPIRNRARDRSLPARDRKLGGPDRDRTFAMNDGALRASPTLSGNQVCLGRAER